MLITPENFDFKICGPDTDFMPAVTPTAKGLDYRGAAVQLLTIDNALACLPLLGLLQKLSFPVAAVSGAARVYSFGTEKPLQASVSFFALGAAYANPLWGAGILTVQDIFLQFQQLQAGRERIFGCFKLAGHSVFLVSLITANLEWVALSLVLQILLGAYQGYQEWQKGHSFQGLVHIAMSIIKAEQLKSLMYLQHKPHWSVDEQEVEGLLGKEYLYLSQKNSKEKLLFLNAEHDHNLAMHPKHSARLLIELNKKYDVKYRTVASLSDVQKEIEIAMRIGKLSVVCINAHGSPEGIDLTQPSTFNTITKSSVSSEIFRGLDAEGIIVLRSCSTGRGVNPFAEKLADTAGNRVFAADETLYGLHYTPSGKFYFESWSDCRPMKMFMPSLRK